MSAHKLVLLLVTCTVIFSAVEFKAAAGTYIICGMGVIYVHMQDARPEHRAVFFYY